MSIKQSILLGLTLLDTMMGEFRDPGGFVSFSYKNLYGFVPKSYKRKTLYTVTHNLRLDKSIVALSRGSFQLTTQGKELAIEAFPRLKFLHWSWDGKWRIVGFDVEEEQRSVRNTLRKILYRCGFGMLQESLYISPLPIEDTVEKFLSSNRGLLMNAYVFVSSTFFLEDRANFIERAFRIERVNNDYRMILEKLEGEIREEKRDQIMREFLDASLRDPFLPKEFLPSNFVRERLWVALQKKGIL